MSETFARSASGAALRCGVRPLNPSTVFSVDGTDSFEVLWADGERVLRGGGLHADADRAAGQALLRAAEHPTAATLDRFVHEYGLKDEPDAARVARSLGARSASIRRLSPAAQGAVPGPALNQEDRYEWTKAAVFDG